MYERKDQMKASSFLELCLCGGTCLCYIEVPFGYLFSSSQSFCHGRRVGK
jgi:hypothetical protein